MIDEPSSMVVEVDKRRTIHDASHKDCNNSRGYFRCGLRINEREGAGVLSLGYRSLRRGRVPLIKGSFSRTLKQV